jgi:hypothetical protein
LVGTPYGEARRLAYFRLISQQAEKYLPCDISFLVENILREAHRMQDALRSYKRTTGTMGTKNVCYNYLRFASWLEFLTIEGTVVSRNAYTVLMSTLESSRQFNLSEKEKLAYFIHLWSRVPELRKVLNGLSSSKALPSGKLQSPGITEHSAETFLEWFVDLDIANPTKRQFGAFVLTPLGEHLKTESDTVEKACCTYAGYLQGKHIEVGKDISRKYLWRQMLTLTRQLSLHIRSPVDPKLVSVLPILLHLQIQILDEKGILIPLNRLIRLVEKATDRDVAIFTWDHAYRSGFLKFR